jgi:histidine triad (HIT) family protein
MGDCIFCLIDKGALPASVVYRDERTLSFMDLNQQTPGHVLVIPHRHYTDLFDITPEDAAAVMETTRVVAAAVKRAVNADGIMLLQSNGKAAMQEVFHFHMHIFARFFDDDIARLGIRGAAKQPPRAELDALARTIAGQLTLKASNRMDPK